LDIWLPRAGGGAGTGCPPSEGARGGLDFIADFMCKELRLVIEVDGITYDNKIGKDNSRDDKLRQAGFYVDHPLHPRQRGTTMKVYSQRAKNTYKKV